MTKSEKKALIEHLNTELTRYMAETWNDKKQDYESYVCWHTHDVEDVIESIIETPEKASLNYEAEYKRVCAEHEKLRAEVDHWKHIANETMERKRELETIVNTLEFIYGRKFEGI